MITRNSDDYFNLVDELSRFPLLNIQWEDNQLFIIGKYKFSAEYLNITCSEDFNLKISIPPEYPFLLPKVYEIGGIIQSDYHKNSSTELCLGTPSDLYLIFNQKKSFSNFMVNIVNPYLYRWCYIKEIGKAPWPERGHGKKGILEFYSNYLDVKNDIFVIKNFLLSLISDNFRSNKLCPCGSGKKIKNCHMQKLKRLYNKIPTSVFVYEFNVIGA